MKILAINAGSSSLKFALYNMEDETCIVTGAFERIGLEGGIYSIKYNGEKIQNKKDFNDHEEAIKTLLDELINLNIIESYDEIQACGHRVVHGGNKYDKSVLITDSVLKDIEDLSSLAPLHNPANLKGILSVRNVLPDVLDVAVFDTAFHQTLEKEQYLYPVPYFWYTDYSVRKYGFHGTSHKFIVNTISEVLGNDNLKVISCHIGNGQSICAAKNKVSVDTTMGFTPNAGLMMGTRSGDIDPSIIPYIMDKANLTIGEVDNALNKESGLVGVSKVSSDHREIIAGVEAGDENCTLANNMFINRIVEKIAYYNVLLGGADVICFTAGLGENASEMREDVLKMLNVIGVKLDNEANKVRGKINKISTDDSSIAVYVVPTDEELMIVRDTYSLVSAK